MKVCLEEIEARERATLASKGRQHTTPRRPRDYPTANTFTSGGESGCVYSKQDGHGPTQCKKVVSIDDWKGVIRKNGRCFNCLRLVETAVPHLDVVIVIGSATLASAGKLKRINLLKMVVVVIVTIVMRWLVMVIHKNQEG